MQTMNCLAIIGIAAASATAQTGTPLTLPSGRIVHLNYIEGGPVSVVGGPSDLVTEWGTIDEGGYYVRSTGGGRTWGHVWKYGPAVFAGTNNGFRESFPNSWGYASSSPLESSSDPIENSCGCELHAEDLGDGDASEASLGGAATAPRNGPDSIIRILILYTDDVLSCVQLEDLPVHAASAVSSVNMALTQSGPGSDGMPVVGRVELAGYEVVPQVYYDSSLRAFSAFSLGVLTQDALANDLTSAYGADVTVLIGSPGCDAGSGIAELVSENDCVQLGPRFTAIGTGQGGGDGLGRTFIHEVGHLFGFKHGTTQSGPGIAGTGTCQPLIGSSCGTTENCRQGIEVESGVTPNLWWLTVMKNTSGAGGGGVQLAGLPLYSNANHYFAPAQAHLGAGFADCIGNFSDDWLYIANRSVGGVNAVDLDCSDTPDSIEIARDPMLDVNSDGVLDSHECRADLTTTSANPGDLNYGIPDGQVDGADLAFFIGSKVECDNGDPICTDFIRCRIDVTTTNTNPGDAGYGVADGVIDGADQSYFVDAWLAGCP